MVREKELLWTGDGSHLHHHRWPFPHPNRPFPRQVRLAEPQKCSHHSSGKRSHRSNCSRQRVSTPHSQNLWSGTATALGARRWKPSRSYWKGRAALRITFLVSGTLSLRNITRAPQDSYYLDPGGASTHKEYCCPLSLPISKCSFELPGLPDTG